MNTLALLTIATLAAAVLPQASPVAPTHSTAHEYLPTTVPTAMIETAAANLPAPAPIQREVLTLEDGSGLRYAVAVPEGYDGSTEVPLILALHFGWGEALPSNYSAIFLEILVEPALRDLGAIIVAPLCPARSWVDTKSEDAVLALLDHMSEAYNVDTDRVAVTGFSLGGMGTWYFADKHTDRFSAAIPMASVPMIPSLDGAVERYSGPGSVDWSQALIDLPIHVVHSRDDELISIGPVEAAARELNDLGGNVEFMAIDAGIGHHETPRYVPYLARVAPWLREVWSR